MKPYNYFLFAAFIVAIDQISKLLVHHYMVLHEEINVIGDWFRLHYVLNPGIAFGINFDIPYSKFLLTCFRLIASLFIAHFLFAKSSDTNTHKGFLFSVSLVLAGALGNVIDSVFYGVFLDGNVISDSFTPWFHGQVIDMLYFPLFSLQLPDWLPVWGGSEFSFFSAIFNIADSSIFIGVVSIIIFQRKFFPEEESANAQTTNENVSPNRVLDINKNTSKDKEIEQNI